MANDCTKFNVVAGSGIDLPRSGWDRLSGRGRHPGGSMDQGRERQVT